MRCLLFFTFFLIPSPVFAFCPAKAEITELNFQFAENLLRTQIQKISLQAEIENQRDIRDFALFDFKNAEKLYQQNIRGRPFYLALRSDYFNQEAALASLLSDLEGIEADLLLWRTRVQNSCKASGMGEELLEAFIAAYSKKWQAQISVYPELLKSSFEEIESLQSQIELTEEQFRRGLFSYIELRNLKNQRERAYRRLGVREQTYRLGQEFLNQIKAISTKE